MGEFFDAIEWVGLDEEESKKLIEKYNKEGKEAGFGQQQPAKRARLDKNETGNREVRDSRNNRDTRDHRDRRNNCKSIVISNLFIVKCYDITNTVYHTLVI